MPYNSPGTQSSFLMPEISATFRRSHVK